MQNQNHIASSIATRKVVFMPSVHNTAMTLLQDAQTYFSEFGDEDQAHLDPHLRAIYNCEMSRITLRLSCVMSWLLARRSAATTSIEDRRIDNYSLEFKEICMVDNHLLHGILPSYVCYLLDASYELYERVERLDTQSQTIH